MAMAKKSAKKVAFKGFVNVSLTKTRKEHITQIFEQGSDGTADIETLTMAGYKVSISLGNDGKFFTCTAMQMDDKSDHAGYCTSSRHGDVTKALCTLRYYIENVLADEGWPTGEMDMDW